MKGYYGTSISDITVAVGITKSSLYSHYSGKDQLFLAVAEDVMREHGMLFERLLEASKEMEIPERLRYNFEEYILYFYRNPEIYYFGNIGLFHVPTKLRKELRSSYLAWEIPYRRRLEEMFRSGIRQGIISQGSQEEMVWSFKINRDGVVGWMHISPELEEDRIESFWNNFWFGVMKRKYN